MIEETRGPFEPLVSSADPPGTAPRLSGGPGVASDAALPAEAAGPDHENKDTASAQARKLEQIKDLYLTAEAIGEANVDKHFDQLLARQRELISEYFKQSSAARSTAGGTGQAETTSAGSGDAGPERSGGAGHSGGPERSGGTGHSGGPGHSGGAGGADGLAGGSRSAPENAGVAADQPRAW